MTKRNMKKAFAILLVVAMMMTIMPTAVFAAGEGSITINGAVVGETYSIYRIFDLESYSGTNHAYKINAKWSAFANQDTVKGVYVNIDTQGYVTWVEKADAAAFAKAAQDYAYKNDIVPDATPVEATSTTVTFTGLDLGYYLVDTSLGSLCSLDTTNKEATISEKNEMAKAVKTVQEDATGAYGNENDADYNQAVNFETTINAKKGAVNYTLHDDMDTALVFNNDVKVKVNGKELNENYYRVVVSPDRELNDTCDFHVVFNPDYLGTITTDTEIVVTYSATLAQGAKVDVAHKNITWLTFGDNQKSEESYTDTYTYDVDIFKYTGADKQALAGAEFVLYTEGVDGKYYAVVENGEFFAWTNRLASATTLISGADGYIHIKGLDADTYYLEETKAPDGYNKLAAPITIQIDNDGNVTYGNNGSGVVEVENKTGTELPGTGGIGTTIFYVVGSMMMIGAGVVLVTRRKMSAK